MRIKLVFSRFLFYIFIASVFMSSLSPFCFFSWLVLLKVCLFFKSYLKSPFSFLILSILSFLSILLHSAIIFCLFYCYFSSFLNCMLSLLIFNLYFLIYAFKAFIPHKNFLCSFNSKCFSIYVNICFAKF